MFKKLRKKENTCYTYFSIRGTFEPDVITEMLGLKPFKSWRSTDLRKNGTQYGFDSWDYGKCEDYDVETERQIKQTISALLPKIEVLKQIKAKFDVEYYIEIVPEIYSYNSTPALGPDLEIIDFCHETRTHIDIDLYVMR